MSSHVTSTIVNVVISAITALIVSRVSKTSLSRNTKPEVNVRDQEQYVVEMVKADTAADMAANKQMQMVQVDYKTICELVKVLNCCLSRKKLEEGAGGGSCTKRQREINLKLFETEQRLGQSSPPLAFGTDLPSPFYK